MVRIGVEAEKADHHPEWANVFGTIDIWLITHDVGGVSLSLGITGLPGTSCSAALSRM